MLYPKISSLNFCQIVIVDVGSCHVVPQILPPPSSTCPNAYLSNSHLIFICKIKKTQVGHKFYMLSHV